MALFIRLLPLLPPTTLWRRVLLAGTSVSTVALAAVAAVEAAGAAVAVATWQAHEGRSSGGRVGYGGAVAGGRVRKGCVWWC